MGWWRILLGALAVWGGLALFPPPLASMTLQVKIANGAVSGELPAQAIGSTRYIALSQIAGFLKVTPTWGDKGQRATLRVAGKLIRVNRESATVTVGGKAVGLNAPSRLVRGALMVPEEFLTKAVALALGRSVTVSEVTAAAKPAPRSSGAVSTAKAEGAVSGLKLVDLRHRSYPRYTRVVLETSGPVEAKIRDAGPKELLVGLPGLSVAPGERTVRDGLVDRVRLERGVGETTLRLVFEGPVTERKVFTLKDPPRLVLDLFRDGGLKTTEKGGAKPRAPRLSLIVIDPGHGGHDPGAIGTGGIQEKDVVLDVSKRLARMVEEKLGVKVVLTRTGDYFVPLRERTSFANGLRADLFVSVHANAHRESDNTGVETYFLSTEASDREARQVAALENSVIELEQGMRGVHGDLLKAVLWDLAQSDFQQESSVLAEVVQISLTQNIRIPNRGVKQAGFYVLGGAAMPAILVEIGFVTNPREERKLGDNEYRQRVAQAIFQGIATYKARFEQRLAASVEAKTP